MDTAVQKVAKRKAAAPKKLAPSCVAKKLEERTPHKPQAWGSDPLFATCAYGCGTTFRRTNTRDKWEEYTPAKPSKSNKAIKRNKAVGLLAQTTLDEQIAQASLFA